jgi:hypothetical protein
MSTELATMPKGLDRCADHIRAAQQKAQKQFADYIETVGSELKKAQRLLADHHAGFGQWVRDEFGWSRQQADRLIKSASVMRLLSPMGDSKSVPLPDSERQCRPLCDIDEPKVVEAVWVRACEAAKEHGKPITAAIVQAARDEVAPKQKAAGKKPPRATAARHGKDEDIEPDQMLDEISYYALAFLDACPERADELEGLLLTWVSRCKQR